MISMLASGAVHGGFESWLGQTRLIKLVPVFAASQLRMQYNGVRASWLAMNQDDVSRVEQHVYPWTVISEI